MNQKEATEDMNKWTLPHPWSCYWNKEFKRLVYKHPEPSVVRFLNLKTHTSALVYLAQSGGYV